MGYISPITGQYELQQAEDNKATHKSEMDKDDFLKLLLAQLGHQDPLNPMEDTDMTSQLAEYSSLEQLTNLNTSMDTLVAQTSTDDMFTAVSFIGKTVKADGYAISKSGGSEVTSVSTLHYSIGEAVSNLTVNIYDPEGDIVRTVNLGSKQPGTFDYQWDGKDENGNVLKDGTYSIGILAQDVSGQAVMIKTEVSGEVTGVVTEDGKQYLKLDDGRYVNFAFINEVVSSDSLESDTETATGGDTTSE